MYMQYRDIRADLALEKSELLPINTTIKSAGSEQVCTTFGLHPHMSSLQQLFQGGDALFIANAGNLVEPVTKRDLQTGRKKAPHQTFNHNSAQHFVMNGDAGSLQRPDGVLGRMMDALDQDGFNTESYSIRGRGATVLKAQNKQSSADYRVVGWNGVPVLDSSFDALLPAMRNLTAMVGEAPLSETWAGQLNASIAESSSLGAILTAAQLEQTWDPTDGHTSLSGQLQNVAKIIKAKADGSITDDRQAFFVYGPQFDSHSGDLLDRLKDVDAAMGSFQAELRAQGTWDKVTVVQTSDFGRSLSSNGDGSDHGWGGNYFVAGGSVLGGQIIGEFPHDISIGSDLDIGRGRMIPTTSWDQVWHGVGEWFGISEAAMPTVLPNMDKFHMDNFHQANLFKADPLLLPVLSLSSYEE
jgi:uncharacterized protein (DUF1501 family)